MNASRRFPVLRFVLGLTLAFWSGAGEAVRAADTWTPGPGWNLVWGDEFNGSAIESANWNFDLGGGGWGNNELQTYTSSAENASVQNGDLVIRAVKKKGNKYSSARLKTQGKRAWHYGKIAARIKLPYGQGIWPAFWMLGNDIGTVGWPRCGEIDVMEMIGGGEGRDDTAYGTVHWADVNGVHVQRSSNPPYRLPDPEIYHDDYHVFEIEWSSTTLTWRIDGDAFFSTPIGAGQPSMEELHQPFFIILNVAVGGRWPGNPNRSTVFPQEMRVDWVRVYQPAP